jgi:hypothetical protein
MKELEKYFKKNLVLCNLNTGFTKELLTQTLNEYL